MLNLLICADKLCQLGYHVQRSRDGYHLDFILIVWRQCVTLVTNIQMLLMMGSLHMTVNLVYIHTGEPISVSTHLLNISKVHFPSYGWARSLMFTEYSN